MPEGPEVKTIVEELNNNVAGKIVKKIVYAKGTQNLLKDLTKSKFEKIILGQKITNVVRVGKYIDIEFSNGTHVIFHLLITGRLSLLKSSKEKLPKYFRFAFVLSDKSFLCLGDMRKWTQLNVVSKDNISDFKHFQNIGIDVFSKDFTIEVFSKLLNSSRKIYTLLLDQKKISGLGNIYVNEVLFITKINPKTCAKDIDQSKIPTIHKAIVDIMHLAYKEKGTTIMSFLENNGGAVGWHTLDGKHGGFWKYVRVFQHEGRPCPICGTLITREKIGGRSAFYCARCQS